MKLITKIAAGLLLSFGLPISLLAAVELCNPKTAAADKEGMVAALIIFGLPPSGLGGWLIWQGQRRWQQQEHDRLREIFFNVLKQSDGHVTPLQLAMETGLSGETAKAYLDERAKEFDASYNVSEEGNISYYFALGQM
jgi:hypothetical protein